MSIHNQCKYNYVPKWMWTVIIISIISWVIILCWGVSSCFAMGKKPLIDSRIQLAEQIKLADRITGIENAQLKLADKLDSQVSAQVGMNNQISKVSSEVRAGRDVVTTNDSEVYKVQLSAQKEMFKMQKEADGYRESVWKNLFYWMVGIIILLIKQVFVFFNKYLDYKEAYIKKLDPSTADEELKNMKAERKKNTLVGKAMKLIKKEV